MVIVFLCLSGSLHIDINGRTFIAHEGDLPVCLPNEFCANYLASDDLDASICITYLYIKTQTNIGELLIELFATCFNLLVSRHFQIGDFGSFGFRGCCFLCNRLWRCRLLLNGCCFLYCSSCCFLSRFLGCCNIDGS